MKHQKVSVVVSCIDYRFWPQALLLLREKYGEFDLIGLAGASKNLASPNNQEDRRVVLENIETSVKLHKATKIILTNHLDCGAYGGSKKFNSSKEEIFFHRKELQKAKRIVEKYFPKLAVETIFLLKDSKNEVNLLS
jgi:carbonic anhydrase